MTAKYQKASCSRYSRKCPKQEINDSLLVYLYLQFTHLYLISINESQLPPFAHIAADSEETEWQQAKLIEILTIYELPKYI
jgi:hypothetical protein